MHVLSQDESELNLNRLMSDESEFDRGRPAREDEEEEDDASPPETSRSDIAFAPPPCRTELTS